MHFKIFMMLRCLTPPGNGKVNMGDAVVSGMVLLINIECR